MPFKTNQPRPLFDRDQLNTGVTMVQIVENWADVEGVVIAVQSQSDLPGQCVVRLTVRRARDVDARPNFLKDRIGETIDIHLSAGTCRDYELQPGLHIVIRTRAAGLNQFFGSSKITLLKD